MDQCVSLAASKHNIRLRPLASCGAWLSFVLPIAVGLSTFTSIKPNHKDVALYAFAQILNLTYLLYHIRQNKSIEIKNISVANIIPSLIFIGLSYYYLQFGLLRSCIASFINFFSLFYGIPFVLKHLPECFTFGEAIVIVEGISLFLYTSVGNIFKLIFIRQAEFNEVETATIILQVGFLGILLILGGVYYHEPFRSTAGFYIWTGCVCICFIFPILHFILRFSPVLWILLFLIKNNYRIILVVTWIFCVVCAFYIVQCHIEKGQPATTNVRKYFHILCVIVFTSGVLCDFVLIYMGSTILLALFIYLETVRKLHIQPLESFLNDGFSIYADEKDIGNVSLTPLYLLSGCCLPLWLHTNQKSNIPALLSGVLSVGIGDTAASFVGVRWGLHKWGDSQKSIEGTVACVLAQVLSILLLCLFNLAVLDVKIFAAILISSLAEAKTDQVDNLVLPLLTYTILSI